MNETSERDLSIENMGETLFNRMVEISNNCPRDSISIYKEWIVDGVDPDDGIEWIFMENFTLSDWTWNFAESNNA
jgi:hypothetical protein